MPSIFTLPQQVVVSVDGEPVAGALVHFFQTGTTTPQNTYQDIALTTPHSNPVEADGGGALPVIYYDPSLPDYRVRVETAAGALIYQEDDIPSSQDETTSFRITSTAPEIVFDETDATSGNRKWRFRLNGEQLTLQVGNDAESVWNSLLTVDRVANDGDEIVIGDSGTEVDLAGVLTITAGTALVNGNLLAILESGSYTGTLTGLTTSPTVTVFYQRAGNIVTLSWTQQSGTSNSTALTVTGMPAGIRPGTARQGIYLSVLDNSATVQGLVTVETSGTLTFSVGAASGTFTGSGSKGVIASTIVYML